MSINVRDQVFLSYAHEDLETVRKVYQGLLDRGLKVWFDETNLGAGTWKDKIIKAIARSRYFVICLSNAALRKTGDETPGFQDKELNTAYEIALTQSEKEFIIVPVRLEDCDRGDHRTSVFNQYNLFNNFEAALDRLAIDIGGFSLSDATAKDARTEDEKLVDALTAKGLISVYFKDNEKALKFFNTGLVITPKNYSVQIMKGIALGNLGKHEAAIESFEEAISLESCVPTAFNNKGIVLDELGRYEEAIKSYEDAIRIEPKNRQAWNNKGVTLDKLGQFQKAIEAYEESICLMPSNYQTWKNKGIALDNIGKHQEAIKAYEEAIRLNPDYHEAWQNKGIALAQLGQYREAIEVCKESFRLKPSDQALMAIKFFETM